MTVTPAAPLTTTSQPAPVAQTSNAPIASNEPPAAPTPAPAKTTPPPTPAPTPAPAPKPKNLYADGTFTGNPADAYYGTVQVQATIQNGKITDVQFLQYPSDRSTSRYINGQAMPYLKQEAIQAQNANVDIVSGATDTSFAFRESLASALALAKN
ncbi:MAG: FMN-binding protein [Patescibacteria group bacterium]|nr:FMN-binding protein [Patescibacteria group bacterium]